MMNAPEINIVSYHNGLKKVLARKEAIGVTFRVKKGNMVDYIHLPKKVYNGFRGEKPVKHWEELPELI